MLAPFVETHKSFPFAINFEPNSMNGIELLIRTFSNDSHRTKCSTHVFKPAELAYFHFSCLYSDLLFTQLRSS